MIAARISSGEAHDCRSPLSRRKEERFSSAAAVCLGRERKSRAAAFPGGDLPEAPGGQKAALSRFAMARDQLFSAAATRGAALQRETK
jgi:hypothetical protein